MIIKSAQSIGRKIIVSRLLSPKSTLFSLCTTSHRCNSNSYYSRRINEQLSSDEPLQQQTSFENENEQFKLSIDSGKLYNDHIRLSLAQRAALSLGSAFMALADPYRDDMVATFGETTGHLALEKMYRKMAAHPEGIQVLQERPRISSETIDIESLRRLPENTFGYAYYRFLNDNGVSPDTRKTVRFVDDAELAYVMQRYREVHDLVHTLLGMPTNMLGEVLVKWVEAIQTDLPMCWLGGLFGPVRLKTRRARDFYVREGLQWALRCGHEAEDLLCVYYERHFEEELAGLRARLKIPALPSGMP